jgi:hypothetical protein
LASITVDDLVTISDRLRKSSGRTLKALDNIIPGIQANFNTDIGYQILKDDLDRFESLLILIIKEAAKPEELAEFRVLRNRLGVISNKIDTYLAVTRKAAGG